MRTVFQPLTRAVDWALETPRQRRGARALFAILGAFLILRALLFFPNAALLWGPSGFAPPSSPLRDPLGVLGRAFAAPESGAVAVSVMGIAGALLIAGRGTRWACLVAAIVLSLLRNRLIEALDAGDNLVRLLLVYGALLVPPRVEHRGPSLANGIHNLGVSLLGAQIALVYFTAAVLKSGGVPWRHGTATYLVSANDLFMPACLRALLKNPWVATLSTYGIVLLQSWYPLALATRFRRAWLVLMLLFHGFTIVGMKLVCFGLAMVGANLFFFTDAEWASARAWALRLARAGSGLGSSLEPPERRPGPGSSAGSDGESEATTRALHNSSVPV